MTSSEIKRELTMLRVDFSDCVSRTELEERLQQARSLGRAPQNIAADDDVPKIDLPPEVMKKISQNPEVRRMLSEPDTLRMFLDIATRDPKMIDKYTSDPDSYRKMQDLSALLFKIAPNHWPPMHLSGYKI